MSNQVPSDKDDAHLTDVPDGAGCTEIWEHLSDGRDEERPGDDNPRKDTGGV
ncbi:hypothetical protein [Halorubrum lacusprofundi]|jgi:hypothetical protein|uniref:Uncharacterized protein n=1 Tax=Halorubrum lacusprofundi (strain ATCC 49239 / DSM 5036 / JCM 8891 / ACAM 34) TaxID=416348 RepID=B9LMT4_HALLT|nr:hypothetical protein [Halorubrum lacusprofundi]ACM56672.1 hypothetical protein Hlac_1077 [Halorubrum lacusprofundi ATCC 49239]